jgi:hypothetical protein
MSKPCNNYAPDTLNPVKEDQDICTTCFYRGIDHKQPKPKKPRSKPSWNRWHEKHDFDIQCD